MDFSRIIFVDDPPISQAIDVESSPPAKLESLWCDAILESGPYKLGQMVDFSSLVTLSMTDKDHSRMFKDQDMLMERTRFVPLTSDPIIELIEKASRLEHLSTSMDQSPRLETKTVNPFCAIAKLDLQTFKFASQHRMKSGELKAFFDNCSPDCRLEELSIAINNAGKSKIVDMIGEKMKNLKSLEIAMASDCSSESMIRLIESLKEVERLKLIGIWDLTTDLVAAIATNSTKLEILHLDVRPCKNPAYDVYGNMA